MAPLGLHVRRFFELRLHAQLLSPSMPRDAWAKSRLYSAMLGSLAARPREATPSCLYSAATYPYLLTGLLELVFGRSWKWGCHFGPYAYAVAAATDSPRAVSRLRHIVCCAKVLSTLCGIDYQVSEALWVRLGSNRDSSCPYAVTAVLAPWQSQLCVATMSLPQVLNLSSGSYFHAQQSRTCVSRCIGPRCPRHDMAERRTSRPTWRGLEQASAAFLLCDGGRYSRGIGRTGQSKPEFLCG